MPKPYDLSGIGNLWMTVLLPPGADGKARELRLDVERAGRQLREKLPTLFQPTGEVWGVADGVPDGHELMGKPKVGLSLLFQLADAGKPAPEYLPSMEAVVAACQRVFGLGAEYTEAATVEVLKAWMAEVQRLVDLKKNTPPSPPTPASTAAPTPGA
jgi:hypothetical protein